MSSAVRVRAYAKINLSLRVLGIRADGYHDLRTIVQTIALHDTLSIRVRPGPFALRCDDPSCPTDSTNLVWRAAEGAWSAAGRRGALRDVEISLGKRIPMQAGLGGGSSDAAAALRVLGSLWRVKGTAMLGVARSLGADVPYFFEGGTVLGLDRGDTLYPLADHPALWVALVLPAFGVSTVEAYGWWDEDGRASARRQDGQNDLQAPVAARHPVISRLVKALERAGAVHAAMSGSGSAVYGLFRERLAAERALGGLGGLGGLGALSGRTLLTRTVNRATYQRLAGIAAHRINLPFAPRSPGHS